MIVSFDLPRRLESSQSLVISSFRYLAPVSKPYLPDSEEQQRDEGSADYYQRRGEDVRDWRQAA